MLRLQGRPVLSWLVAALTAHRQGLPAPSLSNPDSETALSRAAMCWTSALRRFILTGGWSGCPRLTAQINLMLRYPLPRIARPNKPLADVNVLPRPDGAHEVVVCFMPDPDTLDGEGESRAVLALDASRSIKATFGGNSVFDQKPNYVQAVARKMGQILCNVSRTGRVKLLYGALGPGGAGTEFLGEFDAAGCGKATIGGPSKKNWGTGTQLLPPADTVRTRAAYQGAMHKVTVLADGFEYAGERFTSLSAATKSIPDAHTTWFAFVQLHRKSKEARR